VPGKSTKPEKTGTDQGKSDKGKSDKAKPDKSKLDKGKPEKSKTDPSKASKKDVKDSGKASGKGNQGSVGSSLAKKKPR